MTRVVAIHGAAGSGKSTLVRLIQEYLGTDCLTIQENFDDILTTPSSDNNQLSWYRRYTVISAEDNATHRLIDKLTPFSVIVFIFIMYLITGTVWPVVLLFICAFAICRFRRWFYNHIYSKMWRYNVFLFYHRQLKSNCRWICRDRTCVDVYACCIMNNAISVPLDMPAILLEQTHATSVAIILDTPIDFIYKHLETRINASTSSRSLAIASRLLLLIGLFIHESIIVLKFVERWYSKMNIPVIKISQLSEKLDHDTTTGDIQWNKHSINVLLEAIEQAIQQSRPPSSTIDESLMPWQIVRDSRLFRI